jgi:TRAP-type C4-dicarboxylate transport system permease small subunit
MDIDSATTSEAAPRTRSPVTRALERACALMLAVLVVLLFVQVVGRYLFADPPDWTEKLARAVFIHLTFVGGALAIVRNAHLRIETLHDRLSPRTRRVLDLVLILIGASFLAVTVYYSIGLLGRLAHQPMTSVPVSKAFVFAAVPIGCALMLAYELARARALARALADHRDVPQER